MQTIKIIDNKSQNLILFFNGWGMDENIVKNLKTEYYDVIVCSDYRNFDNFNFEILQNYNKIIVIAWSMGVWAVEQISYLNKIKSVILIAINGTGNPIDDNFGIPKNVYQGTIDNFSEQVRQKFFLRMCGSKQVYEKFMENKPERPINEQLEELLFIQNLTKTSVKSEFNWNFAIIGSSDKIFPVSNLMNYWKDKTQVILTDFPHFVFNNYNKWDEIIEFCINKN